MRPKIHDKKIFAIFLLEKLVYLDLRMYKGCSHVWLVIRSIFMTYYCVDYCELLISAQVGIAIATYRQYKPHRFLKCNLFKKFFIHLYLISSNYS